MNTGEVVRLKTGGPDMTVERFDHEGANAHCVWFEKVGSDYGQQGAMLNGGGPKWAGPFRQLFAVSALEKVTQ